jgi:RimJ/RimL family protein N-acetyltransferase
MRTTLVTPRLLLRRVVEADAPAIGALLADPGVFRFLLDGVPATATLVRELILASARSFDEHGAGQFLVTLRESGSTAGLAGFRPAEIGGVELVCALWPRWWRNGLAEEACRACLAFAFDDAGLREIVAAADAPNAASLRLIARLGFHPLRETPGLFGAIRWFIRDRCNGRR